MLLGSAIAPVLLPDVKPSIQIPHAQADPGGMEQVIFGGYYFVLSSTSTQYNSLIGGVTWAVAESGRYQLISTDGVIKNLRFKLDGPPGVGTKYTFTLMLNGNPTALTFDIADTATTGSNMVNEITVTGGDYVTIRCVPDSTPTVRYATWTTMFEGDTPGESIILGGTYNPLDNTATEYGQVMGAYTVYSTTENDFRQVVPTAGTFKNLYVKLLEDPGTAPDAYRFTVRKNGISQPLTVTVTADDMTGNDLVNSFAVVAGDVLTIMIEPLNTPSAEPRVICGMTFVADINGESIVMGGSTDHLDNAATEYIHLTGFEGTSWTATENQRYQLGQDCTLEKLHILLSGAPGAGNKYDFTLRIAGADSNVVATVSDTDTTGDSGALEDTVTDDEYVVLQVVPDDTPAMYDAYWGFVCYINPAQFTTTWTFESCQSSTHTSTTTSDVTSTTSCASTTYDTTITSYSATTSSSLTTSTTANWLLGWDQRVKFTVNSTDFDEAQTNFPVLIYLGTSAGENNEDITLVFDEVGVNNLKIAITQSDGTTELYVEVDKWDLGNEKAWLWFKAPSISNISDTDFYLYFDNDHADNDAHVGETNSEVAENVWDSDYELVSHMRDDPDNIHIRDSTSNDNDGTKKAANQPIVTTAGYIDDAQDWDMTTEYYINFTDVPFDYERTDTFTFGCYFKTYALPVHQALFSKMMTDAPFTGYQVRMVAAEVAADADIYVFLMHDQGDVDYISVKTPSGYGDNSWHRLDVSYDGSSTAAGVEMYIDGSPIVEDVGVDSLTDSILNNLPIQLGMRNFTDDGFAGLMDEPRVSNIVRTPAWIKASYESGRDHLLDFGSEETNGVTTITSCTSSTTTSTITTIITTTSTSESTGSGTDTITTTAITHWTVIQVVVDPLTTETVTSACITTCETSTSTSFLSTTTTCDTSVYSSTSSTTTCETVTETETETSTTTTTITTCLSSTVTLLTFCTTSTIPTSCTTISSTSCETSSDTLSTTTTTCTTTTWTETTTYLSTVDG